MYDIVTIGATVVDIFIQSDEFDVEHLHDGVKLCQTYGEKIDVDSMKICTGGGGGNTAVGFARAGFHTAVISETGRDPFASLILADFASEDVATRNIVAEKREQTGGSIILIGKGGGRTILVHRGAASMITPADLPLHVVETAGWLHASNLSGQVGTIQALARARQTKKNFSWNPGAGELHLLATRQLNLAKLSLSVLVCNQAEWLILQKVQEEVVTHVPLVVVTKGKHGGTYYKNSLKGTAFVSNPTQAVDETGAGDAFCVGLISALQWGFDIPSAIACGKASATSVVSHIGAKQGLLTKHALLAAKHT